MTIKIPQSVREGQIDSIENLTFVSWPNGYSGARSKATVSCKCGYTWDVAVKHVLSGSGCPRCAGVPRYTQSEREEQINKLPNVKFVRWHDGYRNSKSMVVVSRKGVEVLIRLSALMSGSLQSSKIKVAVSYKSFSELEAIRVTLGLGTIAEAVEMLLQTTVTES